MIYGPSPITKEEIDPESYQQLWKLQEELDPEMWRRVYSRIYENYKPNLYASPKEVARQIFSLVQKVETGYLGDSEKYEMIWASHMYKWKFPIYWVAPDLYDAVRQTTPPIEKLDYYNMAMPFNAAAFMIPKGKLIHPTEGEVYFIAYSRHKAYEVFPSVARIGPKEWSSLNGGLISVAKTSRYLTHWNMPYDAFPYADLTRLDDELRRYEMNTHTTAFFNTPDLQMTPDDTKLGIEVAHMIFGLLLFIQRKPELLSGGELLKRVKADKGKQPREFWSPRVIGENYRIRRLTSKLGGTHASPRGHWVRGFWKEQRYGPQNSLTKEILIDPYWRGGDED